MSTVLPFGGVAIHLGVIASVLLSSRRDPSATLAWALFLTLAPFVGVVAYLLFGRTRMSRAIKRCQRVEQRLSGVLARHSVLEKIGDAEAAGRISDRTRAMVQLGRALASTPASTGNRTVVLQDGAATYREIERALENAKDHIHVAFYIIQPDEVGQLLRSILTRKASEGVQVRVLADAIGSAGLPAGFRRPLEAKGGQTAFFAPVIWAFHRRASRDRVDFRDHRKIAVVDGQTGFTGGINVGKEYLGLDPAIGHWRDTHVRLDGPAVLSLQHAFAQDWLTATGEVMDHERYYPDCPTWDADDQSIVQGVDSGPDRNWSSITMMHVDGITRSKERVWLTSSYFIPNQPILTALTTAALRGVDVRLLLPAKSDSRLVGLASKHYYRNLLGAGVRIFEYARGFVHAKTMVVDDWMGTVESANMDMRSFNLNFELNAFVFNPTFADTLADQYLKDLGKAREVTLDGERQVALPSRLLRSTARLFSPLL